MGVPPLFDHRGRYQRNHHENDEALLAWRKNKHREQPFHFVA